MMIEANTILLIAVRVFLFLLILPLVLSALYVYAKFWIDSILVCRKLIRCVSKLAKKKGDMCENSVVDFL
jgi:hypothetical protein